MKPITILGPFTPYRGGIATHTTCLHNALKPHYDIYAEAYDTPFPKALYPGQHIGNLRSHPDRIPGVHYELSYRWPGAWPKVAKRVINRRPRAVIIPWWTFFFAPHYYWLASRLTKKNIPIIFLCHNLFDHEAAGWKKWLSLKALGKGTAFLCHSPEEQALAQKHFPDKPCLFYPHPTYNQFTKRNTAPACVKTIQLLFFGLVRPYKGLDTLITALEDRAVEAHLTVAGEWWGKQTELLARCKSLESQGRLTLLDHYIDDDTAEQLFADCHCVVLPYKKATNSGVLAHAIHMGKPAIASHTGAFPDCIKEGETGLLIPADDPQSLTNAIQKLQKMYLDGHDFTPAIETMAQTMSWETFAGKVSEFITSIESTGPKA